MRFLQTLAGFPQAVAKFFWPEGQNSIRTLRQAGSAIGILAESFTIDTDEWNFEPGRLDRKGVEVSWRGNLTSQRTAVHVKIDGKVVRMSAVEREVLKAAAIELVGKKQQA